MIEFLFGFGLGFFGALIVIAIGKQIREGEKVEEILHNYLTENENGKRN